MAKSEEAIEVLVRQITYGCEVMVEFADGLSDSKRETKKAYQKIISDAASAQKRLLEQEQSTFQKSSKEAMEVLRRKKSKLGFAEVFDQDWKVGGHPEVATYANAEALKLAWDKDSNTMNSEPFVANLASAVGAIQDPKLHKTILDFIALFPQNEKTLKSDMVAAPLTTAHGADGLKPVWSEAFPSNHVLKDQLTRLSSVALKPWLIGYLATCIHMDFEPERLGTQKVICSGKLKVLLVSAQEIKQSKILGAMKEGDEVRDVLTKYFDNIKSAEAVAKVRSLGIKVHHVTLDSSVAPLLVVPPGWFQMACVVEDVPVVGVRVSQLVKSTSARQNLGACLHTAFDQQSVQPWLDLLDVHLVAKS